MVQFNKCLAKTLVIEGDTNIDRESSRKDMTSEELDKEFRELNASQLQANARLAVEQITGTKGVLRKEKVAEKVAALGRRMMRAEEESGEGGCLPLVTEILSAKSKGSGAVKNVKTIVEKKGKKIVRVPDPIIEEMELEGEEVEVDFERENSEGRVEIPKEISDEIVARSVFGEGETEGIEPVDTLSTTFFQSLVSDKMDVDLCEEYDLSI